MKKLYNYLLSVFSLALITVYAYTSFTPVNAQTVNAVPTPTPAVVSTPLPSPTPDVFKDEVFTVDTEEVNLNIRVVDRNNRPISNVSQSDFKIYEDNVLQEITFFDKSEVPMNYALVIDNSGSLRRQLNEVIEASKIIVGTNKPGDEASIVRFVSSDKIEIAQDFTSNKSYLTEALDNLYIEGGPTAIIDAVYLAAEKVDEHDRSRKSDDKKRRALILVSDGEDRDSFYKEQQLFSRLREADVQIYTIGFTNELDKEGGFISKSPRDKAVNLMKRLAEETGGKSYFPTSTSELPQIARDIVAELRTQYLVSYSPPESAKKGNGTFHSIKVVVGDGPGSQKRIAITRSGRTEGKDNTAPTTVKRNN